MEVKVSKKILIIGPTPLPAHGVSIFTKKLVDSLKEEYRVVHLDTSDRRTKPNIGNLDFTNVRLALLHILKMIFIIIKNRPEISYIPISQNTLGFLRDGIFIIIGKILGTKVVIHLHGGIFDVFYKKSNIFMKLFIRFSFKCVDRAIVLCEGFYNIFDGLIKREYVKVVRNGVDLEISDLEYESKIERLKKNNENNYQILFIGTLDRRKGFIDLIKAAIIVLKKYDKLKFIIAGGWYFEEDKKEALSLIEKYQLKDKIIFPGYIGGKEKWKLFLDSDIFIFPSHFIEGQPIVVIEAMMAALPIIATNTGCLKDMIKENVNGYKIKIGDIEKLAESIINLIQNKDLLINIAKNNRKEFLENYTWDKTISTLKEIFENLI